MMTALRLGALGLLGLLAGLGLLLEAAPAPAPPSLPRLIAAAEPGWPQWRGPYRDGIARETNLLKQWPEGGPPRLWEIHFLGRGYSAPVLAANQIFITGDVGEHLVIYALDMEGKLRWQVTNGASWKDPYPGARAAVAYDRGRLYHMNAHGRVVCLDAQSGRELWWVDILQRFQARNITWALSECLLVDERHVYVTAGGDAALMAALDKNTGETRWASPPLRLNSPENAADRASYASPILFEWAGRRHLVNCSQTHAFGVDATTGALLWTYPMPTTYKVLAATPVLIGDGVFVTGPDSPGGTLLRIRDTGREVSVSPKWISKLDTCHGGIIQVKDLLVGSWYRGRRGWACLDAQTGELLHQTNALAKGSQIFADGRFYWLTEDGLLALVEADREKFALVSQFRFVEKHKNDVWAHPVIWQGRLYLRYHERLACYDLRPRE
ncbi:MAG: PQQ-binding-like beta-propeller repeat protein [Verrucomicrobiae bacterium]|nr:PQQ-binding-like beta-propeller repeat protein [Verrucomicrobiae bacterium]